ncbi:U3 snoRNP protein [Malassezia cuniculi]|uniref:U3 snoRNP protein n=1 Tax=Malassezia cuniculi TaxID=948313 RepID=A0AAF0ENE3_9BASI|nr:U3 snoRNP protein [Malassezia cuniculi]
MLRVTAVRTTSRLLSTSARLHASGTPPSTPPPQPKDRKVEEPAVKKPSFTQSTSEAAAAANAQPLPYLTHPLGVDKRPTSKKLTFAERHPEWFDRDARMEDRRKIVKEATRGYFHDFHAMRAHGGKTWRAPSTMIRQDRALYFPDIKGTALSDSSTKHTTDLFHEKVSIVSILTSKVSEEHTRSFYTQAVERFASNANFQLVQINLQENALKAYLISLFLSSLRKQIPPKDQATYLLSSQNMDAVRENIGMENKHVGYTYLVGPDGKIRWAGCGFAESDEERALTACTAVLLDRLPGTKMQYSLERSLPQLQLLDREGLLSKEELRSITSQRSDFEARLVRRRAEKQDFVLYLEFEENFNKFVTLRARQREREAHAYAKEHGDRSKLLPRNFFSKQAASYSATCISIYERLVRKFRWDVDSWERYLSWAQSRKMRVVTGRVYARAIALHPKVVSLWLQAADYELNDNGDTTTARSLLQRALRMNTLDSDAVDARESKLQKTSSGAARAVGSISWEPTEYERNVLRLWIEYFRMELVFIERLRRRWKVLGMEVNMQGPAGSSAGGFAAATKAARSVAVEAAPVDEEAAQIEREVQDEVPEADDEQEEEDHVPSVAPAQGNSVPDGHRRIMQGAIPLVLLKSAQESVPSALQLLLYAALLQLFAAFPFFDSTALSNGHVACLDTSSSRNGDALRARLCGAVLEALESVAARWGAEGQMLANVIASIQPMLCPHGSGAVSGSSASDELDKNILLHRASKINAQYSEPIDALYAYAQPPTDLRELAEGQNWDTSRGVLFVTSLLSQNMVERRVRVAEDSDSLSAVSDDVAVEWQPTELSALYTRTGVLPELIEQLVASLRARLAKDPNEMLAVCAIALLRMLANTTRSGIEEENLLRYLRHVETRLVREYQQGRPWLALVRLVPQWRDVKDGADATALAGELSELAASGVCGAFLLSARIAAIAREGGQEVTGVDAALAADWSGADEGVAAWKSVLAQCTTVAAFGESDPSWAVLLLWLESERVAAIGSDVVCSNSARVALWSGYLGWVQSTASTSGKEAAAQWAWDLYLGAVKQTGAILASSQLVGSARIDAQRLHDSVVKRMYLFSPAAAPVFAGSDQAARDAALRSLFASSTASTVCWLEIARLERVHGDISGHAKQQPSKRVVRLYEHAVQQSERDADVVTTWIEYLTYLVSESIPDAMKQLPRATEHVKHIGGAAAADRLERGWQQIVSS